MKLSHFTTSACATALLATATVAGTPWDWEVTDDIGGMGVWGYDGPPSLMEIDTNFDLTNFVGQPLIGMSFSILPTAGEVYDPGEFESIVFDLVADTPGDSMPWVPPSLMNTSDFTVVPSDFTSEGPQTITYLFPDDPLLPFETLMARFQIEWPSDNLFDIRVTPIIPTPGALALFAAAGFVGRRRRRRG